MLILYDNYFDNAIVTIPNENLYYGVDNLKDYRLSKYYKPNNFVTTIDIDFEEDKKIIEEEATKIMKNLNNERK